MADELFGSPVGTRLFEQDYNAALGSGLKSLETVGQIAMQPAQQANLVAEARLRNAQAGKAEEDVKRAQQMTQLAQLAMGKSPGGSTAEKLDSVANLAINSGLLEEGAKLAGQAATIRSREASAQSAAATQLLNAAKLQRERTGQLASYFGAADSPEAWQNANDLYEFQTGQKSPYATVPFDPELVKGIQTAALDAKTREELLDKELRRAATTEWRKRRGDQFDVGNNLARQRLELSRLRERRLERSGGGKKITTPATSEIRMAKSLIDKEFPVGKFDVPDREEAAFTIASDARALMRSNPALDPAEALNRAFVAARGDFGVTPKTFGADSVKFSRAGRTPETALPLPQNPKDPKAYVPGRFYLGKNGQPGLWNGSKFLTGMDAMRAISGNNTRADDESEDDGTDDEGEE